MMSSGREGGQPEKKKRTLSPTPSTPHTHTLDQLKTELSKDMINFGFHQTSEIPYILSTFEEWDWMPKLCTLLSKVKKEGIPEEKRYVICKKIISLTLSYLKTEFAESPAMSNSDKKALKEEMVEMGYDSSDIDSILIEFSDWDWTRNLSVLTKKIKGMGFMTPPEFIQEINKKLVSLALDFLRRAKSIGKMIIDEYAEVKKRKTILVSRRGRKRERRRREGWKKKFFF